MSNAPTIRTTRPARLPLIPASALQAGDRVCQSYTLTSHASIMVLRQGAHVGNMTQAQADRIAGLWQTSTGSLWGNRINLTIVAQAEG